MRAARLLIKLYLIEEETSALIKKDRSTPAQVG